MQIFAKLRDIRGDRMNYLKEALNTLNESNFSNDEMQRINSALKEMDTLDRTIDIFNDIAEYIPSNYVKKIKDVLDSYDIKKLPHIVTLITVMFGAKIPIVNKRTFIKYFRECVLDESDEYLISLMKGSDQAIVGKDVVDDEPMFVTPKGVVISANPEIQSMHNEIIYDLTFAAIRDKYPDAIFKVADIDDQLSLVDSITFNKNWARMNPITPDVEDRFYCVLPNEMTNAQYNILERFFSLAEHKEIPNDEAIAYMKEESHQMRFLMSEYTPKEVVSRIRRYYSLGIDEGKMPKTAHCNSETISTHNLSISTKKCLRMSENNRIHNYNNLVESEIENAFVSNLNSDDVEILSRMISSIQTQNYFKNDSEFYSNNEMNAISSMIDDYKNLIKGKDTRDTFNWKDEDIKLKNDLEWNLEKYIDSLHDKYRRFIDDKNKSEIVINRRNFDRYFNNYIASMSDAEIISMCGIKTSNEVSKSGPMFLLSDGSIINAMDQNSDISSDNHENFFIKMCDKIFRAKIGDKYKCGFNGEYWANALDNMTMTMGWSRLNPMTPNVESRFYCVLSNKEFMTPAVYEKLEEFLDIGSMKANKVSIFATDTFDYKEYFFDNNTADDVLKKIKRFYANGYFVESSKLEINESKELPTEKEVLDAIEKMSDDDDFSYVNSDALAIDSPVIMLTPSGEIIDIGDYDQHTSFLETLFSKYLKDSMYSDAFSYEYVTQKLKFITLNTGDGYGDDRCKVVIDFNTNPTKEQYANLEEWLEKRFDSGSLKDIIVYCNGNQKEYNMRYTYPEEIIKKIKSCFNFGYLESKNLHK